MITYVGVDVSAEHLDVAIGNQRGSQRFANSAAGIQALIQLLVSRNEPLHVILEPTSTYHQHLLLALARAEVPYSCINPARTNAYATVQGRRAKTDRADARLLAVLGERERPEPSPAPDEAQERLKALRRHWEWLQDQAQAARNRLGAAERSPWTPAAVRESLQRTIRELEEEAALVEQELQAQVRQDERWAPAVALLDSVAGIGWRSAVVLVSEMPAVERCKSAKSWVAFAGVNPEVHESGKLRTTRLSRKGSASIRRRLHMAAVSAMRYNPPVRALAERLQARGKPGKVRVMAALNMLLRLCFGVLRHRQPFNPQWQQDRLPA